MPRRTIFLPDDLRFHKMSVSSDFDLYERLARTEMHAEDLVLGGELRRWISEGKVRAWMVKEDTDELVGWCSVMVPSPCHPYSTAVHLLGGIVFDDKKGREIGKAMAGWCVGQFGNHPLTASVRPGNTASECVLAHCGFRRGLPEPSGPWLVWHRPGDERLTALVRWSRKGSLIEEYDTDNAADAVILGMRAQGWAVEALCNDQEPQVSVDAPYCRWPDPAAFHTVIQINQPGN